MKNDVILVINQKAQERKKQGVDVTNGSIGMEGKKELYHQGEVHYCPKGSSHEIRNEGKKTLICLCVVPKQ